ncbi:hypothetical protein LVY75_13425 [Sinorhizobium sp. B11]
MRAFALITMFFGWLVYSTMSAWAGCPTCASMNMAVQAEIGAAHLHTDGMDMGGMMSKSDMAAKNNSAKDPCATGAAHMPLCAACMVMPPAYFIADDGKAAFAYPAPALDRALRDNRPAPQAPPPRLI